MHYYMWTYNVTNMCVREEVGTMSSRQILNHASQRTRWITLQFNIQSITLRQNMNVHIDRTHI